MVSTVEELEACLGAPGLPAKLKAIDHMDAHAAHWIAASPLMALIVRDKHGVLRATLGGADPGFAEATSRTTLSIKTSALDHAEGIARGDGVSALFIAPNVTETLRVAGRVATTTHDEIKLDIAECFVHCGKALIRSQFWLTGPRPSPQTPQGARFCVLGTADSDGNTDASPKGDPDGFLTLLDENTIALPDRSGNRRADGHRNILSCERVALIAFAPGDTQAFEIAGRARLTSDVRLLAPMSVENKAPKLATLIAIDEMRIYASTALRRARLWDADRRTAPRPNAAAALAAHIKLSQARTKAAAFEITPEMTEKALAADYKANLY